MTILVTRLINSAQRFHITVIVLVRYGNTRIILSVADGHSVDWQSVSYNLVRVQNFVTLG